MMWGVVMTVSRAVMWQGMLRNPKDEDIRASILRHAGKEDQFNAFTKARIQSCA